MPAPGTAFRLLDELEKEFLRSHATDDPYPHLAFREWLKTNTIIGYPVEQALPSPAARSTAPPAAKENPLQTAATPPTPSRETAKICPFHAAFLWGCAGETGVTKPCRYGSSCTSPHIDPGTLSLPEISAACTSILHPGKYLDSILAAATLHSSKP